MAKDEQLVAKDSWWQIDRVDSGGEEAAHCGTKYDKQLDSGCLVNCYGKKLDHISDRILGESTNPATAVAEFIKLKHKKEPSMRNRYSNLKRHVSSSCSRRRQHEGREYRPRGVVGRSLQRMRHLEAEADEDDYFGNRF